MAKQKSLIPIIHANQLPHDVRTAIAHLKTGLKAALPSRAQVFHNTPPVLPNTDDGCQYYEFQVGAAHPGDARPAGKRRLVVEINDKARQIREVYFTDQHYAAGSFRRVVS